MPKSLLYVIIAIETMVLIVLGVLFVTQTTTETPSTAPQTQVVGLSSRAMTVYVKATGGGDRTIDVVGKIYVQDDASGRTEFLFDIGAGCFPTWTLDPQNGFNLLVADDVDVDNAALDTLMKQGQLHYEFRANSDLEIRKTLGIRGATLAFDGQHLRLNQQCS